jgi:hypothetical protein
MSRAARPDDVLKGLRAVDALLEENATLRGDDWMPTTDYERTRGEMEKRGLTNWVQSLDGYLGSTAYGYVQLPFIERAEAAEALVVSLTEERDSRVTYEDFQDVCDQWYAAEGIIAQLREALSEIFGFQVDPDDDASYCLAEVRKIALAALAPHVAFDRKPSEVHIKRGQEIEAALAVAEVGCADEDPLGSGAHGPVPKAGPSSSAAGVPSTPPEPQPGDFMHLPEHVEMDTDEVLGGVGDARVTAEEASHE